MKLYDIPIEANEIEAVLADTCGELTPEIEGRIRAFLRESKEKVESAAMVVLSLEDDAEVCRTEAERLMKRAAGLENGARHLKGLMLFAVDEGFGGRIKTAKFTIWGQSSAATISFELPPGADVHNVPLEYLRMKDPELDKQALKAALDAELPIPDQIVVSEKPGTRYLRIK
jgi:Siphovirus Gp157